MKIIKLPTMHTNDKTYETVYIMTTADGTTHTKKLKDIIQATDDMPKITVFSDHTFTIGNEPHVYSKVGTDWTHHFSFVQIKEDIIVNDDKEDGGLMQWLKQPLTVIPGLRSSNMAIKKKEE